MSLKVPKGGGPDLFKSGYKVSLELVMKGEWDVSEGVPSDAERMYMGRVISRKAQRADD